MISTFAMRLAALTLAALGASGTARAQGYPCKPVTLIVPFAAGSPTDMVAPSIGADTSTGANGCWRRPETGSSAL